MKKVLFTIGMIAILVGVAFAGMAASGQNSGVPGYISALDAKVTDIQVSVADLNHNVATLTQGNITMMQTMSGIEEGWTGMRTEVVIIEKSFDSIRHFHVTCKIVTPQTGVIEGLIQNGVGTLEVVHHNLIQAATAGAEDFTDEFDASKIRITLPESLIDIQYKVVYAVTMTYENQP